MITMMSRMMMVMVMMSLLSGATQREANNEDRMMTTIMSGMMMVIVMMLLLSGATQKEANNERGKKLANYTAAAAQSGRNNIFVSRLCNEKKR